MPRRHLMVSVARGTLTRSDVRDHRDRLLAHPHYHPGMGLLLDLRRVTRFDMTSNDMRSHADSGLGVGQRYARLAILAPADLGFGLARAYQAYLGAQYDHESFRIFRESGEAWAWLREGLEG